VVVCFDLGRSQGRLNAQKEDLAVRESGFSPLILSTSVVDELAAVAIGTVEALMEALAQASLILQRMVRLRHQLLLSMRERALDKVNSFKWVLRYRCRCKSPSAPSICKSRSCSLPRQQLRGIGCSDRTKRVSSQVGFG